MITAVTQRWRAGRDRYRPVGETIDTHRHEVAPILDDVTPRTFVEREHYSRSYPAARFRFGLYRRDELVGVAVFSNPVNDLTLGVLPGEKEERVELGRFVLLDDVPSNGETWFLARAFELLRLEGLAGVLSMSDPLPRHDATGATISPGHIGTIYQAFNGVYLGRTKRHTIRLFEDGTVLNNRSLGKLRAKARANPDPNKTRGWHYVVDELIAHGASPPGRDLEAWRLRWVRELTRPVRHPGNHRYAWTLRRRDRRHLPPSKPYPKFEVRRAA